jgi:hypothetical protein
MELNEYTFRMAEMRQYPFFGLFLVSLFSFAPAQAQDTLFKRDGHKQIVKVLEVNESIVYKRRDLPEGPSYSIPQADVESIHYSNGDWDHFQYHAPSAPATNLKPMPGPVVQRTEWEKRDSTKESHRRADKRYKKYIYANLAGTVFRIEPNLGFEQMYTTRLTWYASAAYKFENILVDVLGFESTYGINQLYWGPSIQGGLRYYGRHNRVFAGLGLKTSFLFIRDSKLYSNGGSSYGFYEPIYSSNRQDLQLKLSAGVQPFKTKHKSHMYLLFGIGLQYTHANTQTGPQQTNSGYTPYAPKGDMPQMPVFLSSKDVIPRGHYLTPCLQFGLVLAFGVGEEIENK